MEVTSYSISNVSKQYTTFQVKYSMKEERKMVIKGNQQDKKRECFIKLNQW